MEITTSQKGEAFQVELSGDVSHIRTVIQYAGILGSQHTGTINNLHKGNYIFQYRTEGEAAEMATWFERAVSREDSIRGN